MMDRRVWLSHRALKLHAVIIVVVPAFLALCVWQLSRALGGNELSWAYVFEWPFFAGYAVYMWWRFVHEVPDVPATPSDAAPRVPAAAAPGATNHAADRDAADHDQGAADEEADSELAAYNAYLAQLAARDKAAGR